MITPVQSRRARRIPDQIWNNLREELVDTYLRDDVELKDMPKIIAEKHNLAVTEVQLKDRFRKWQIKKNFPQSALAAMSSLKRMRNAVGKDARFKYNGIDVEPERLERALKRRKENLPSPEFIPASVKLYVTPAQSFRMTESIVASPILTSQRTQNLVADWELFNPVFPSDGEDLPDQVCEAPLQHCATVNIAPYGAISDSNKTILRSPDLAIDGSLSKSISIEGLHSVRGEIRMSSPLYDSLIQEDPQLHSMVSSVNSASITWSRFIEWSPASESRGRTLEGTFDASRDAHIGNSGSNERLVVGVQMASSNSIRGSPIDSEALSVSLGQEDDFTVFDPEKMFINLQHMKTRLADMLVKTRNTYLSDHTATSHTVHHLHNYALGDNVSASQRLHVGFYSHLDTLLLQSPWLQNQIEALLYQASVDSATAIRRRLLRMENPGSMVELDATEGGASESHPNKWFFTKKSTFYSKNNGPEQGVRGFAITRSNTDIFAILHRTAACEAKHGNKPSRRATIALKYFPTQTPGTQGLEVTFTQPPQSIWETHICPSIRTFNVIPKHSEIFRCVQKNDLQRVRLLFDSKEASPRDVDDAGHSLLSYVKGSACHDIFELLLMGGADMYNVSCYSQTSDVITMIWQHSQDEACARAPVTLSDCIRMTRTALAYGCDVSERIKQCRLVPDPLFRLDSSKFYDRRGRVLPAGIHYVLDLGYELEERNIDGFTPLLYAASQFSKTTTRALQALIEKKADLSATDLHGKNALQIAQKPFWVMESWQTSELSREWRAIPRPNGGPAKGEDHAHVLFNRCFKLCKTDCTVQEEGFDEEPFDLLEPDHWLLHCSDSSDLRHRHYPGTPPNAHMEIEEVSSLDGTHMSETLNDDSNDELEDLVEIALGHQCDREGYQACHPECSIDLSSWRLYAETDGSMRVIDLSGDYDVDLVPTVVGCGCTTLIRNPIPILKRRAKFKLLTLLRAGCDPNHIDKHDQSSSDDARYHNLWPEWTWALLNSGYAYDDDTERWVKSSISA